MKKKNDEKLEGTCAPPAYVTYRPTSSQRFTLDVVCGRIKLKPVEALGMMC